MFCYVCFFDETISLLTCCFFFSMFVHLLSPLMVLVSSLPFVSHFLVVVVNLTRMLFIPIVFLQLIQQPTHSFNTTHSRTSIKLLHVSASGRHHQGVIQNKAVQAQYANLGIVSPLLELLKYYNTKIHKVRWCGIPHRPTWHTSHAPSGQCLLGSHKVETDVCMHAPYRVLRTANLHQELFTFNVTTF
jgi:hypothetical protein